MKTFNQFIVEAKGVKLIPVKHYDEKEERFEVHHEGKHLGDIHSYSDRETIRDKKTGRGFSGKIVRKWAASPKKGEDTGGTIMGLSNKQHAVRSLQRAHGLLDF